MSDHFVRHHNRHHNSGGSITNLGYRRKESELHDRLQARLLVGAWLDRDVQRLTDFQTAQLGKDDTCWTTSGVAEERPGGADSYKSPHLRYRDYHASLHVLVALRLDPAAESPTLDDLAQALDHPGSPAFHWPQDLPAQSTRLRGLA